MQMDEEEIMMILNKLKGFWKDEEGIGTLEILLIIAVIVIIAIALAMCHWV
jgi:Flp pilus assembly pilin Flp